MKLGLIAYANDFLYGNAKRFHKDLVPDNPPRVRLVRESWTVNELVFLPREKPEGEDDWMTPFGYHPDPKKRFQFQYKISAA